MGGMARTVVRLTLDHLDALARRRAAPACSGSSTPSAAAGSTDPARAEKEAWVSEVLREWGSCGRVALVDDEAVGYLIYAPAAFVPGRGRLPHRAGVSGRGAADDRVRRRGARGGGPGPDAGAGHGPRPGRAAGSGRSRRSRTAAPPLRPAAWCRPSSWRRRASRPTARTPAPRGCGWSCGRWSPGATRWRPRSRGWSAPYDRRRSRRHAPEGAHAVDAGRSVAVVSSRDRPDVRR